MSECPVPHDKEATASVSESENPAIPSPTPQTARPRTNQDWWPNLLDLSVLHTHSPRSNPMGEDFDYAEEFETLDVEALKRDMMELMTSSQDWWPADYGHYGGLFIRMSWHAAGTYRIADGRGGGGQGAQRFAPLNSWPDNVSLDKARRLLWPLKKKYGKKISWADLIIFAGHCAYESMGLKTFGFGFGREDIYEPEEIFWGPEDTWLGDERFSGDRELHGELGALQLGLIYVNPEGPNGQPSALAAARDIRETFARMAMNDEETAALIIGGHTVGKAHGAGPRRPPRPGSRRGAAGGAGAGLEQPLRHRQGWRHDHQRARGRVDRPSRPSGTAATWTTCSRTTGTWSRARPGRGSGCRRTPRPEDTVPDAHDPAKRHEPIMFTTDLAMKLDPIYGPIAKRFHDDPEYFAQAFAKAWYKLLHRDMGPVTRYLGPWVPEPQLWQDPVPAVDHELIDDADVAALKGTLLDSGLSAAQLISTAWSSAASFRGTDLRGGANGARIRLAPQQRLGGQRAGRRWPTVLPVLERVQQEFNAERAGKKVSLADLIVLGGCAAVEQAARNAGVEVTVPFAPGRTDASQEQTDVESFAVLERRADGFRNYLREGVKLSPETLLVDRAYMLKLSAPEMAVLVGGPAGARRERRGAPSTASSPTGPAR